MQKIPFSIDLKNKKFNGYLQITDIMDLPKVFFVFLENYIVGELLFNKYWKFEQRGRYKFIGQLNTGECNYLAEYLGNLVELAYESK